MNYIYVFKDGSSDLDSKSILQLGFLVAASSNARHLKERMEYMNDSYQYSTDNINGNVKPIAQDKSPHNNNQSDTAI